jgi:hypothetical protein
MKTKRIHFPIVPPTKTSGKIHVPPHLPAMHGIQIWVGRRNAGKSVAATNLIKRYLDIGVIERVILVSPTYESNMHTFAPLKLDPTQDVIEPTKDAVQKVKEKLEEETKEWEAYHQKKKEWEAYQKHMRSTPQGITSNQLLGWEDMGFFEMKEPPRWKRPDDTHPTRIYVLCDDVFGSPMLRMGKGQEDFVNLCIAHRHQMCSGNIGYGCSIGILTQSYSAIASVPRPVRENCTLLCLFLNSDEKQRKKIKEELSDIPNLEHFESFWDYATKKPHGFLCIDMNPPTPDRRFRSQYNEYLY